MQLSTFLMLSTSLSLALTENVNERTNNWTVGQTVLTSSGPVNGHPASNATEVSEYLAIPYAQPPVGDLRWAAPQAYSGSQVINGTNFGFSCPSNRPEVSGGSDSNTTNVNLTTAGYQLLAEYSQLGQTFSEDCLTLNVWTKPQVGEKQKAVLLWIHGGAFTRGSSSTAAYTGQYIADLEDVILVSINYRLNIFGFPGSPSGTNNLGLLDQRLAVEWVHSNIASFGGDNSRITLFGQSAGGASVDYYSYAWTDNPLVAGLISESGTVIGLGQRSPERSEAQWYEITTLLNCGDSSADSSAVLACMREKDVSTILDAASNVNGSFTPSVDEVVVYSDYSARSAVGDFIKVPLIIGNTDYEAGLFELMLALSGTTHPPAFWATFNLNIFACPAAERANISISKGVPTWRYRWFGNFPNTRLTTIPDSRSWHGSELPLLFNTLPSGPGVPGDISNEAEIESYVRGAWATFAKDPVNGLQTFRLGAWPIYELGKPTLARLAWMNLTGSNLGYRAPYDALCNIGS